MKGFIRLLRLDFIPRSVDCGLLVLRLWLGLSLICLHGWTKLSKFSSMSSKFADPLGIGTTQSLALATFAEAVCAILIVLGLFTRLASLALAINLGVAFVLVHKLVFKGSGGGELAWIYLAGFIVLFVAGPGRLSIDGKT